MTRDELVERMARAICLDDGRYCDWRCADEAARDCVGYRQTVFKDTATAALTELEKHAVVIVTIGAAR